MISEELLKILVCPETKQALKLVDEKDVFKINEAISLGKVKNRAGELVREKIDAALIRQDRSWIYPIRSDIPIMLIDEALKTEAVLPSALG